VVVVVVVTRVPPLIKVRLVSIHLYGAPVTGSAVWPLRDSDTVSISRS